MREMVSEPESRLLCAWQLAVLRFAVTLDDDDRIHALGVAGEVDRLGGAADDAFHFFRRTTAELCAAISGRGVDRAAVIRRFLAQIDNVRLKRAFEAAIAKVSQEIGTSSIELAEELSLLSAELSYLPDRRMAYENLGKRTNHPGVKSVAVAMTQAETYGTPLSSALRVMAKENRDLRLSAAEKKAAALPAQLTVPMILFFLPVLFIVILGPAILNIMDTMAKG